MRVPCAPLVLCAHGGKAAFSPDGAAEYSRGQATRSPRSRGLQQTTPPWGGAGGGWRLAGGYASLAPGYVLSPRQGEARALTINNQLLTFNR